MLKTRRAIVWVASIVFGGAATLGVIFAVQSNFAKFTVGLFPGDLPLVLLLAFASLGFIWLDFILRTEYLRS